VSAAEQRNKEELAAMERDLKQCAGVIKRLETEVRAERQRAAAAESRLAEEQRY
jgi:hypothetical protein